MRVGQRLSLSHIVMMILGLFLGAFLATARPGVDRAVGGDRSNESILATGPMAIFYNKTAGVQVAQDAIYYLDYRATKLIATVPVYKTAGGSNLVPGFAERDLVADFKLDLDTGPSPHILITTPSMNTGGTSLYGEGLALLFVYETTTRQVAAYKLSQFQISTTYQHRLDLLELKSFGKPTQKP